MICNPAGSLSPVPSAQEGAAIGDTTHIHTTGVGKTTHISALTGHCVGSVPFSDFFTLGFKLGLKKWFLIFGLMMVTGVIGALGAIACFVGMFFTLSIMYLPTYLVYKDIFGFDNISAIDKIGTE